MTKPHEVLGSPAPVLFISFPDAVVLHSGRTQLKILILHTCYEYHSRLYAFRIWTMLLFRRSFLHFPQQTALLCQLSSACSCMSALHEPLHFSASKKTKVNSVNLSHLSLTMWCSLLTLSLTCFTCSNRKGRWLTRAFISRNSLMYSLILCWSAALHIEKIIVRATVVDTYLQLLLRNLRTNNLTWPVLTGGAAVFQYALLSSCCAGPAALHEVWQSSSWPGTSFGASSSSLHSPDSCYPLSPLPFCRVKI